MYGPVSVILPSDDAVLAECEVLLRRTLDLFDGHRMNRVIAARLAHLIHDVSVERARGQSVIEECDLLI